MSPSNPSRKTQNKWQDLRVVSAASFLAAMSVGLMAFKSVPKTNAHNTFSITDRIKNWGIANPSSTLANKEPKSDISAPAAWKIEEGSRSVIVAVIDTGLDANHKDLAVNVWKDKGVNYGWNFVTDKPNPTDEHGHGTHVAGIIGAIGNPESGAFGVAKRVSIMSVKYYSETNSGAVNLRNTVKAINYAVDHGAKIINYSGGGPEFSEDEQLAIKRAEARGVLVVAAAGNEHQNTDLAENYYYPAAYRLSNMVTVAATDIRNNLLPSSNWGKTKVDVAAPGETIFSTLPNNRYGTMTGTSQATAFVSGLAALLLSHNPKLTPQQIREIIVRSADSLPQLQNKVAAGGRINAYAALTALESGNKIPAPTLLAGDRKPVSMPGNLSGDMMQSLANPVQSE